MLPRSFMNLNSAYRGILRDLLIEGNDVNSTTDPLSIGSQFGKGTRPTREIIGYSFSIEAPSERIAFLSSRRINLPFAVANCIWTMSGLDDLSFINFYNERGSQFSDDQITLHGAHGKRLFDVNGINQIEAVIDRLRKDPYSRRTVAAIYHYDDSYIASKDIPCPIAVQYLQRDGKLHAITYMRSQSSAMVLPYDVFAFTFIQEALAIELGFELGRYYHISGSFHFYLDEEPIVRRIIDENERSSYDINIRAPRMPRAASPFEMISRIVALEDKIRTQMQSGQGNIELGISDMPKFWQDVVLILVIGIAKKCGRDYESYLARLSEYYSNFLSLPPQL